MKKKTLSILIALLLSATLSFAQNMPAMPQEPTLEFVLELKVNIGQAINVGQTAHGNRIIIPITGGTFEGPNIKGTILSGGADYQLAGKGRNEVEAIYTICTDDGVNIHVRNMGLICTGDHGFYFRTTPKFEAPNDSKYDWLNNAIFVCMPGQGQGGYLSLKVWKVN